MTPFQELLVQQEACEDFRLWAGAKTLREAWSACPKAEWMLGLAAWMAGTPGWPTHPQVLMAMATIARTALPHAGEVLAPARTGIEAAEAWAADPSSEKREAARDAARAGRDAAERVESWMEAFLERGSESWMEAKAVSRVTRAGAWAALSAIYPVAEATEEEARSVARGMAYSAARVVEFSAAPARALEAEHAAICRRMLPVPQRLDGEGETNDEEEGMKL